MLRVLDSLCFSVDESCEWNVSQYHQNLQHWKKPPGPEAVCCGDLRSPWGARSRWEGPLWDAWPLHLWYPCKQLGDCLPYEKIHATGHQLSTPLLSRRQILHMLALWTTHLMIWTIELFTLEIPIFSPKGAYFILCRPLLRPTTTAKEESGWGGQDRTSSSFRIPWSLMAHIRGASPAF